MNKEKLHRHFFMLIWKFNDTNNSIILGFNYKNQLSDFCYFSLLY